MACDAVPLRGVRVPGVDSSSQLGNVRRSLQGYVRCFPPGDYFRYKKLAQAVVWAEVLFEPDTSGAQNLRRSCRLAAGTLALLLCVNLFAWNGVRQLLEHGPGGAHFADLRESLAAKEALGALELAVKLPWADQNAAEPWPFFALLAILSERLASTSTSSTASSLAPLEALWKAWLESGNWSLPGEAKAEAEVQGVDCDAVTAMGAVTSALAALPEPSLQSSALPLAWEGLARPISEVPRKALATAQAQVLRCRQASDSWHRLLSPSWGTFWRGLDRLSAARDVMVSLQLQLDDRIHLSEKSRELLRNHSVPVAFFMSLHPPHLPTKAAEEGYWFLADRIRASGSPHCNPAFLYVAEMLDLHRSIKQIASPMRLVDIGAHLGDCVLWAAARWSDARILAVEMRADNAGHLRRAAQLGGHEGRLEIRSLEVTSAASACDPLQGRSTIDCILDHWAQEEIELVSVFLGGEGEVQALLGGLKWLRSKRLQGVLVRSTSSPIESFWRLLEEHSLPYRLVTLRTEHDLILVRLDSYLDHLLKR